MRFAYAFPVLLLLAAIAGAQTKEIVEEVDAKIAGLRIAARHADERNEDVEILRRLLNKAVGLEPTVSVLPSPPQSWHTGSSTFVPNSMFGSGTVHSPDSIGIAFNWTQGQRVSQAVGPFDGVYLKGAGVVYTLHVPAGTDLTFDPHNRRVGVNAGCSKCHQDAAVKLISHTTDANSNCTSCHTVGEVKPGVKPLSDWEQARLAVRGEKPTPPEPRKTDKPRAALCDPGSLTEQVIGQLVEHARNVRYLGENEAIRVVITFDGLPGQVAKSGLTPDEFPSGGGWGMKSYQLDAKPGFTPDELQALTLADLHLKQGKYAEAVEAYRTGLARFHDAAVNVSFPPSMPWKDAEAAVREITTNTRAAYKSLATAYLQLGDLEQARWALDQATGFQLTLSQSSGGATPKPAGPAKLILSLAKSDIDLREKYPVVISTKNYQSLLKKAVTVEWQNLPAAEGKK